MKENNPDFNEVQIFGMRDPNKGDARFPEWMTARMRGLRFAVAVPCTACGKKRKRHWTMLMNFKAVDFKHSMVVAKEFPQVFLALTPVCGDHPLIPIMPTLPKKKKAK